MMDGAQATNMVPWVCIVAEWIKTKTYLQLDEYIIGLLSVSVLQKTIVSNMLSARPKCLFETLWIRAWQHKNAPCTYPRLTQVTPL
jgi:hypothetical protein